jgi:hypothetical protein
MRDMAGAEHIDRKRVFAEAALCGLLPGLVGGLVLGAVVGVVVGLGGFLTRVAREAVVPADTGFTERFTIALTIGVGLAALAVLAILVAWVAYPN